RINGVNLAQIGTIEETQTIEIEDLYLEKKIIIRTDTPFKVHYFQLQTLSQSEQGFDLSVQGLSLALVFAFDTVLDLSGILEITRV
ncbi:MAG: DUF1926 domain-containing protein, partial [Campylobacterales bacterium]|nr:DUF1926 domain-containing protein [Campylobacterales bacterium]